LRGENFALQFVHACGRAGPVFSLATMMPIPVRWVEKNSVGFHLQINSLAKPRRVPTRPHSGQVETRTYPAGSLAFVSAIDQAGSAAQARLKPVAIADFGSDPDVDDAVKLKKIIL
jgi:hypothetical protein